MGRGKGLAQIAPSGIIPGETFGKGKKDKGKKLEALDSPEPIADFICSFGVSFYCARPAMSFWARLFSQFIPR